MGETIQEVLVFCSGVGTILGLLLMFQKPIKAWLDARDEKKETKKALKDNDTQTEKNKLDLIEVQKVLDKQTLWNKKTDEKLERDFVLLGSLDADMKLLKNGQFDTNRSLEIISEQIGLVACLLTGDEKAKELIKVIGDSYKDREKARIVGEK